MQQQQTVTKTTNEAYNSSYSSVMGSSGYNSSGTYLDNNNKKYLNGLEILTPTNGYTSYVTGGGLLTNPIYETHPSSNMYDSDYGSYGIPDTKKLSSPLINNDKLAYEVLAKAGPANTYQRQDYSHDIGSLVQNVDLNKNYSNSNNKPYDSYTSFDNFEETNVNIIKIDEPSTTHSPNPINQDPNPIRIVKPNNQNIVYKQQVNIRYLQPPTPPPPAPIIIRERQISPPSNQPPIIIRQTAPAAPTPPPLTIRERAPTPPPLYEPTIIERPVPAQSQPRQVIIERVPAPPVKPRPIIYEKWLPYKSVNRPVIVQKIKQSTQQHPPPKNVIIEYEKPKAVAIRQVIEEGIFRVDPATYQSAHSEGEVRIVDRITDLPIQNSRILAQLSESTNKSNSGSSEINLIDSDKVTKFTKTSENVEYETITTTVSEELANKIIAEAKSAGSSVKPNKNQQY